MEQMIFFVLVSQRAFVSPPFSNYPMLDIIPINGSRNETNIIPINKHSIITKAGSKIEIK